MVNYSSDFRTTSPEHLRRHVHLEALHGAVCGSEDGWTPLAAGGEEYAGLPETETEARKNLPGLQAGGCGAFLGALATPHPSHSRIRLARTIRYLYNLYYVYLLKP
jgi:hypothetical protein